MSHPRAGQPAEGRDLVHVPRLLAAYYTERPDPAEVEPAEPAYDQQKAEPKTLALA